MKFTNTLAAVALAFASTAATADDTVAPTMQMDQEMIKNQTGGGETALLPLVIMLLLVALVTKTSGGGAAPVVEDVFFD